MWPEVVLTFGSGQILRCDHINFSYFNVRVFLICCAVKFGFSFHTIYLFVTLALIKRCLACVAHAWFTTTGLFKWTNRSLFKTAEILSDILLISATISSPQGTHRSKILPQIGALNKSYKSAV